MMKKGRQQKNGRSTQGRGDGQTGGGGQNQRFKIHAEPVGSPMDPENQTIGDSPELNRKEKLSKKITSAEGANNTALRNTAGRGK